VEPLDSGLVRDIEGSMDFLVEKSIMEKRKEKKIPEQRRKWLEDGVINGACLLMIVCTVR